VTPPERIKQLVEQFDDHKDTYHSAHYNEAQLRQEFLNPFFQALGWDVFNRKGYSEAHKEVIHEDAIKVGGRTKAPDYCFRAGGGVRSFFVEAKKPSVDIHDAISPAFQLRRYAWSAKLPLSILTDFEEFSVYDCRIRPSKTDKASTGRILYVKYTEYPDRWDALCELLSPEAVRRGAIEKYLGSKRVAKGTAEVDAAFLAEIESWRDALARNLALRNKAISQRDLNFAVQRTIDRIIFLRICEDRGIEPYGTLQALENGPNVYARLGELFRRADDRYNSGLFYFAPERGRRDPPDELTLGLTIDDRVLKDILKDLYYPDSPYEFAVLPAEILGQVYEQFLGKVIRLTKGHQAKVEEKPEVKKAGGVYYTPAYIVDYIVRHTVGKLVEGRAPQEIGGLTAAWKPSKTARPLTVLDPACGSGSFLLGAYQFLLDWHRDWYENDGPEKHARAKQPRVYQSATAGWRLTTAEKKRILLAHVHGVDVDSQAVEVTKLSLLLKVLEGESGETLELQRRWWHQRALPDLADNIKCGNSLIGPDFYEGRQKNLFDEEEALRINAFDWKAEFPDIFKGKNPGFDAVIGNPPYIRLQTMKETQPAAVPYFSSRYRAAAKGNYDIYVVFIEKGLSLLNSDGHLGFIVPHKFFNAKYGEPLRCLLAEGKHLSHVVHFSDQQVFERATTYTCLLFLVQSPTRECWFAKVDTLAEWCMAGTATTGIVKASQVTSKEWNFVVGEGAALFERLLRMPTKLGDLANIYVGLQTSADPVFLFKDVHSLMGKTVHVSSKQLDETVSIESELLKLVVRSGDIGRYFAHVTAAVLFPYAFTDGKAILISESIMKKAYPHAWEYLRRNMSLLAKREHDKFRATGWYQLYPKNLDLWEQPKILLPYMITRLSAYYDRENNYFVNVTTGGFGVTVPPEHGDLRYFTALLNSRLLDWIMKNVSTTFHGGYFAANKQFLVQLPICALDLKDSTDKRKHNKMISLVDSMQTLHEELARATTPHQKNVLQRRIDATDHEIDQLVYELYGLSDKEIAIVQHSGQ